MDRGSNPRLTLTSSHRSLSMGWCTASAMHQLRAQLRTNTAARRVMARGCRNFIALQNSQKPVTLGLDMPSMPPEEAPITCSFTSHSRSEALRWSQMSVGCPARGIRLIANCAMATKD